MRMKDVFSRILTSIMVFGLLGLPGMALTQEGVWKTKSGLMPTERMLLSASVVDGVIYAIGGALNVFDPALATIGAVEAYNPLTDTWIKKVDMLTPRWGLSTSAVNGKIYAIGGMSGISYQGLKTVEEYDPKTDKWTKKADMPTGRFVLSTAVVDGIIYAIGGAKDGGWQAMSTVEAYDPVADKWTNKAGMPTPREAFSVCAVDGVIYAIEGWSWLGNARVCIATVDVYNPKTDTWTKKADATIARGVFSASAVDKTIYVFGGSLMHTGDNYSGMSTVEAYNIKTDTWRRMADMPTERGRLATGVVNGKIYVIGGSKNFLTSFGLKSFTLTTVEEFTPPEALLITAVSPQGKLTTMWGKVKQGR